MASLNSSKALKGICFFDSLLNFSRFRSMVSITIVIMITYAFQFSETLEPEIIKSRATGSQPLCMEQFGRLVNAYRMPGKKRLLQT